MTTEEKAKAALLEATRKMLDESSQRVAEARDGTEALKKESEEARQAFATAQEAQEAAAKEVAQKQAFIGGKYIFSAYFAKQPKRTCLIGYKRSYKVLGMKSR